MATDFVRVPPMTDPLAAESRALSTERIPLTRAAELDTLDDAELREGYLDGFKNQPCGGNRSRSFWHGHRNGMVDGGHAKGDAAQRALAHNYVATNEKPRSRVRARGSERVGDNSFDLI